MPKVEFTQATLHHKLSLRLTIPMKNVGKIIDMH
jgi:hypothetical protein